MCANLLQSGTTLCNPMDCSLPGSSVHGREYRRGLPCPPPGDHPDPGIQFTSLRPLLLAGSLFPTSATWEIHTKLFSSVQLLSRVHLIATPCIAARQASLSITNSRSLLRLMCIKSVMPSRHLILCRPLLFLPPVPPSIRVLFQ